jgi:hypothetical protein
MMDKKQAAQLIALMERQATALDRLSLTFDYLVSNLEVMCVWYGKPQSRPPMQPDDDNMPF